MTLETKRTSEPNWRSSPRRRKSRRRCGSSCKRGSRSWTQERDQARRALNQARQELDLAPRVQLRAVGPVVTTRAREHSLHRIALFEAHRTTQFSICNECIDEMYQASNEFIAKGGPSMQPSLVHQKDHPSLPAAMTVIEHAESFWVQDARPGGPAQTDRPG
jgi:hypothetical protein